ncbi:MAG: DUF5110 domain-containing protein, partial [Bacteroidetes bacterium]|nr:DUF5110 domain-containing protein [Bacteroidota bacterium]
FHLNRSGFAGSQRFSIFPWSGDISRSWSGLRAQLPLMLGMSMSGIPYIHADAGGFAGGEGDNELYVRWLQFAAFTPIFRPHGTALYSIDPAAFSFPSEPALIDEPYRDMAKQMVDLRYSMLPYNYTLAYRQAKYGEPLVRPLYYQFTDDTTASSIQDEFMWGDDILIAPVVEKGQQVRKYYLPERHWYNLMNQSILNGGNWYADSVALDKLPILIKEGSFICFDRSERKDMMKYKGDSLAVLYVESGKASDGFIYNDDGVSKNAIKNKQYELINFTSTGLQDHELAVTIKSDKGAYAGKPLKRNMYFTIAQQNGKPVRIAVNGKTRTEIKGMGVLNNTNYVVDENGLINLSLVFTGQPVTIQVNW